jgi:hypothetical protein
LGKIIHTINPTRQRTLVIKKMTADVREFLRTPKNDTERKNFGVGLAASLEEIRESVDRTAAAWEKRDYWIKADAFRRQWSWVEKFLTGIKESVSSNNPTQLQKQIIELGEKLGPWKIS